MRWLYLRGQADIRKRLLVHACGFNLGVLMRSVTGTGTPRTLQGQGRQLGDTRILIIHLPFRAPMKAFRMRLGLSQGHSPKLA